MGASIGVDADACVCLGLIGWTFLPELGECRVFEERELALLLIMKMMKSAGHLG
jgi:hypothetical protein